MKGAALPYAGTSGWSGTDTSKARADHRDKSGKTGEFQQAVLDLLNTRGYAGATWKEVADTLGAHHGTASGALSLLHKTGDIARLTTPRRTRCRIYVLPKYVAGRATDEQGRHRLTAEEKERLEEVAEHLRFDWYYDGDAADDLEFLVKIVERLA